MPTLAETLKELMHLNQLNASELARRTGIGQPVINRIANGITTNPNVATLSPIASFFSTTISELIGDIPLIKRNTQPQTNHNTQQVPLINWFEAIDWGGLKNIKKKHRMIITSKLLSDSAFALPIEEEVDLRFPRNSLIIIEPIKKIKSRDYVIVEQKHQPKALLKRYIVEGDTIYLKPIDPDLKTLEFTPDFKVIGVVVQSIFDFD